MKRYILIALGNIVAVLVVVWLLPLPSAITSEQVTTTRILDRNGALLYAVQNGGLTDELPFERIPKTIVDALIATEDRTFFSNPGVSLRGLARAFWHDLQALQFIEGGSTITQQFVRTKLQPKRRTVLYKFREMWLALKVNARMTKKEVLEQFLSSAYFGQQAYGIQAASMTYFDKDVSRLSLSESAMLIGLLNAPTSLNPFKNLQGARERRDLVLNAMLVTQKISQDEYESAIDEPLALTQARVDIKAPHFVMWLRSNRSKLFERDNDVKTTLDLDLQTETEDVIRYQLEKLKDKNVTSASAVILDAKTGDILTMVGSADYFDAEHDGQVNVALAPRQPGSATKPFVYALALEQGMTAATTVADVEARFLTQEGNPYVPRNYDFLYHGLVRFREALANSYNIAAVKVLEKVGVARFLGFMKSLGITTFTESPEHYGLALALGDGEVKLLELAEAYGIFARQGKTLSARSLESDPIVAGTQVIMPSTAWLIANILDDEDARLSEFGEGGPLDFDFPVAAKTGTTRNSRDNWTFGVTPDRIVGVWVGNADNTPMRGTSGVTGAGPIFHDVMIAATSHIDRKNFERPSDIRDLQICKLSGKLPTELCPATITEHFAVGTEPKVFDDMHRKVKIDNRNGFLADESCPKESVKEELFTFFPPELQQWAREEGWKSPPTQQSPLCRQTNALTVSGSIVITRPAQGAGYRLDPLIPDESEQIILEAQADAESIVWSVDGVRVGEGSRPNFRMKWKPTEGTHRISAEVNGQSDSVTIEVIR